MDHPLYPVDLVMLVEPYEFPFVQKYWQRLHHPCLESCRSFFPFLFIPSRQKYLRWSSEVKCDCNSKKVLLLQPHDSQTLTASVSAVSSECKVDLFYARLSFLFETIDGFEIHAELILYHRMDLMMPRSILSRIVIFGMHFSSCSISLSQILLRVSIPFPEHLLLDRDAHFVTHFQLELARMFRSV